MGVVESSYQLSRFLGFRCFLFWLRTFIFRCDFIFDVCCIKSLGVLRGGFGEGSYFYLFMQSTVFTRFRIRFFSGIFTVRFRFEILMWFEGREQSQRVFGSVVWIFGLFWVGSRFVVCFWVRYVGFCIFFCFMKIGIFIRYFRVSVDF